MNFLALRDAPLDRHELVGLEIADIRQSAAAAHPEVVDLTDQAATLRR